MMEKSLRNQPFSDAMLREMAIHLPEGNTSRSILSLIQPY
jgi:hypothetical protein